MAPMDGVVPAHISKLSLDLARISPERLRLRQSSITPYAESPMDLLTPSPAKLTAAEPSPIMSQADEAMDLYLRALGAGPYQNGCLFFGIVAIFTQELHYFLPEVVAQPPKFRCSGTNASLAKQNPCLEPGTNDSCTSWEFDVPDKKISIVSEWELVCENAWWRDKSLQAYTVGAIVGIILAASLCDRFTMGYVYYAVVLSYIRLTSMVFNFDVRGALGPPTLVLAYLLAETLGRRPSVAMALSTTGITAVLTSYLIHLEDLMTCIALVCLSGINVASCQLPLLTVELYPSALRVPTFCSAMLAGQLGALVAPFVRKQALRVGPYWPLFIIGLTSLTCGVLLMALPETKFEGMMAAKEWDEDDQAGGRITANEANHD
ncbi:hypothetical protein HPB50_006347 [Hyalomma asiaticum]|uniref:Uncharacterized protein n=1 Tax=Hyalomma asiaticum TaxID=266040 RepID=A0ACB7S0R2_HYAAI|nr:hypothetical protein HPB50_006347 [Hyalomma asiaticum]